VPAFAGERVRRPRIGRHLHLPRASHLRQRLLWLLRLIARTSSQFMEVP
jgi:hypothetical protein